MTLPSNVTRTDTISYDNRETADTTPDYKEVKFMKLQDFIKMMQGLRESESDIDTYTIQGDNGDEISLIYRTDQFPTWYTSYDNSTILFDAFRSDIDSTMQQSKSLCYGSVYPVFELDDAFEPDLDPTQFSLFLNRAKVRAFAELKQVANQEAAGEARRQKIIVQKRNEQRVPTGAPIYQTPRYGRK